MSSRARAQQLAEALRPLDAVAYAAAAARNGRALLDSACILRDAGQFGAARALAISAREEGGKAFLALLYVVGLTDELTFAQQILGHTEKQAHGVVAGMLTRLLDTNPGLLTSLFVVDRQPPSEARRQLAENFRQLPRLTAATKLPIDLSELQASLSEARTNVHEKRRKSGLYVDLEPTPAGTVLHTPQSIDRSEVDAEIRDTSVALRAMERLEAPDPEYRPGPDGLTNEEAVAWLRTLFTPPS